MPVIWKRISAYGALLCAGGFIGFAMTVTFWSPRIGERSTPALSVPAAIEKSQRRILYYKNPMGHPDTSPVPKKDEMGMDYLPVYDGEDDDPGAVKVSADRIQKLGIRTAPAEMRTYARTIRATGLVKYHEGRQVVVTTRFDGWIDKLLVKQTGDVVRRGQPLAEFFSFDLHRVVLEYINNPVSPAARGADLGPMYRLRNLGIAEQDVQRIIREGRATQTLPLRSPIDGVVLEKKAVEGMRAAAGEVLFRIVELGTVWLIVDIYERDLADIALGQDVEATFLALPSRRLSGKLTFIYPSINSAARAAQVRIELPNPDRDLLIDMFATVEIKAGRERGPVLSIPENAAIESGTRSIVLVEKNEGRFEPRVIQPGQRGDGYLQVLEGLKEGERVVVAGNFLIDAESNLKSALRAFMADKANDPLLKSGVPPERKP